MVHWWNCRRDVLERTGNSSSSLLCSSCLVCTAMRSTGNQQESPQASRAPSQQRVWTYAASAPCWVKHHHVRACCRCCTRPVLLHGAALTSAGVHTHATQEDWLAQTVCPSAKLKTAQMKISHMHQLGWRLQIVHLRLGRLVQTSTKRPVGTATWPRASTRA